MFIQNKRENTDNILTFKFDDRSIHSADVQSITLQNWNCRTYILVC